MPKIKVADATPTQINWLVATIEYPNDTMVKERIHLDLVDHSYPFCDDPAQGQPILEREKLVLEPRFGGDGWQAHKRFGAPCLMGGPTMLIAGLRCFCASRMGEEVEVPEELITNQGAI